MFSKVKNNVQSSLSQSISTSLTTGATFTVSEISSFPDTILGEHFYVTIYNSSNKAEEGVSFEHMKVWKNISEIEIIERPVGGTTQIGFSSGDYIELAVMAEHLEELQEAITTLEVPPSTAFDHISATDNPHSVSKAQVGLGNVPDTDFTSAVDANTAKVSFDSTASTKLGTIETSADVTDTANVTAAGALMDSELTSIADVKALDQSVVSGAAPVFDASNMTNIPAGTVDVLSNVATARILGRTTAGSGNSEELTAAATRTLLNVEDGATADQTGAQIKTAYEAEANAFTDAKNTKLTGIEALADVTDATNVAAAGAAIPTGTPDGTKFLRDDSVWTAIPGGGDALTANPLSQFAATTSAQLAGVLSDETGTGALVFGTSPNILTPTGIVKGDVGLGDVDNTADTAKPVSTAQQTALDAINSYPSGDATKVSHITVTQAVNLDTIEADTATNNAKIGITAGQADAIIANTAKIGITAGQADAIIANTAKVGITAGQVAKVNHITVTEAVNLDTGVVRMTGDQTVAGIKTFSVSPIVPAPTTDLQVATKKYVDDNAGGGGGGLGFINTFVLGTAFEGAIFPRQGYYVRIIANESADFSIMGTLLSAVNSTNPTLELGIYSDAGTLLESKTGVPSATGVFEVTFDDAVTLVKGTAYWLGINNQTTGDTTTAVPWHNPGGVQIASFIRFAEPTAALPTTLPAGTTGRAYYMHIRN